MKSSHEDIALLNEYLKGRLSSEGLAALKERLAVESDLYADLQDIRIIQEGIGVSVLKGKLVMMKEWEEVPINKLNNKWWKWGVFTLLFVMLGYLLYNLALKPKQAVPDEYKTLYAAEFDKSLILHSTKRSVEQMDTLTAVQRRAYEMYSIQLFEEAIPLLDELWEGQKDTLALFYLGVSHIGVGDKENGLVILQKPELSKYSKQTNLFINH